MSLQQTQLVDMGEIHVSTNKMVVFTIPNLGTGVALTIYDYLHQVAGIAHIVLPESALSEAYADELSGKFANLAIPILVEQFNKLGGQKRDSVVRMVGGAQLFNFGGGGGNILNIGARNATAIRAGMSKQGFVIQKADTGGNKGKSVRFMVATGEIFVCPIGGKDYLL